MFGLNTNWLEKLNNALFGHNLNCLIPEERISKQAAVVPSQLCCFCVVLSIIKATRLFCNISLTVFVLAGWTSCHPLRWTSSSLRAKLVAKNTLLCVMQKLSFESTYKMRPGQEFVGKKGAIKVFFVAVSILLRCIQIGIAVPTMNNLFGCIQHNNSKLFCNPTWLRQ